MLLATGASPASVPVDAVAEDSADRIVAERAELARDLIDFARAHRDPAALITAATILAEGKIVLVPAENAPLIMGRARTPEELPMLDADALLAEARAFAADDIGLLDRIDALQAEAGKGIVPNAIAYTHDLGAGRSLTMRARAEGGRIAIVRVRGDGDAPLALSVRDADGRQACFETQEPGTDGRGDLVCRWTPPRTGTYAIELGNRGRVWSRMILVSN